MGYFSRFPNLYYDLNKDKKLQLATDILRRVAFSDRSKASDAIYVDYTIKDGETPEMIADRLYENENMYWVVLMFNEIININDQWPMDSLTFDKFVAKKYPGYALYFTYDDPPGPFSGCITQSNDVDITGIHQIKKGDLVVQDGGVAPKSAIIQEVDLDYNRIIVSEADAAVICAGGQCTSGINGVKFKVYDSATRNTDGTIRTGSPELARIKIHKRSLNRETVHHFVNDTLQELNQWATYDGEIQAGTKDQLLYGGVYNNNVSCTENQSNITTVPIASTPLGSYMGLSTGEISQLLQWKSNYVYELELNDAKRDIKLMRPEMVADVVVQFEELINR